ncbi:redoxin domain-containing protein [Luteolibacter pohnpeiensis]|uniref:Redoxin domain-containing protein n=1 Tax=Luteolibacter pohnpeiensis TaxID=454153 RepID=A0A934S525_9BACT|nr:redoxin domain-containing protein [Luteolibacter pohnpeiensis]MBK1882701.1 redoxin domain-containing protein [Luteolibacter pohnpeiensis]
MPITVGQKAPDFTLVSKTASGPEVVKLSDHFGKANIVLVFFPMAFTSVCTTEMCDLSNGISDYEKLDAKVFGISGDSPFAQEIWAQKENITIPLLSDYEHEVAEAYGIAYEQFLPAKNLIMGGVSKRSAFVIDKEGTVQYAEVLESPGDLPDFEAVKKALASL